MEKELALPIVICVLVQNNKVLFIKRKKGDYIGLWGLPGGKIEKKEYLSEASEREILEEVGIMAKFEKFLGLVSEHLVEKGKILKHFLLYLCQLSPQSFQPSCKGEEESRWFDLEEIEKKKREIIPSDFLMIEKIIKNKEGVYYNCIIEKINDNFVLKEFKRRG